jgi:hypothetical protein
MDQASFRAGGQNLHLTLNLGWHDQVIVIQEGGILSRGSPNACVAGRRYVLIGLFQVGDSPSILRHHLGRIVR